MFERNKIDTAGTQQQMTVPVEVTLEDGEFIRGKFIVPASRTLFDVLNNAGAFVEFEPYGGERSIIAKSAIKAIRLVNAPTPQNLNARGREIDSFDPFAVLGIARGAPFEDAKAAYHALAKVYHPDRYSGVDLPEEVSDYLSGHGPAHQFRLCGARRARTSPKGRRTAGRTGLHLAVACLIRSAKLALFFLVKSRQQCVDIGPIGLGGVLALSLLLLPGPRARG